MLFSDNFYFGPLEPVGRAATYIVEADKKIAGLINEVSSLWHDNALTIRNNIRAREELLANMKEEVRKAEQRADMYQGAHLLASAQRGELVNKLQVAQKNINRLGAVENTLRHVVAVESQAYWKVRDREKILIRENKELQAKADKFKSFAQAEVKILVGKLSNQRAKVWELKAESQRRANVIADKELEIIRLNQYTPVIAALNFTASVQKDLRVAKERITELSREVIKLQVCLAGAGGEQANLRKTIRELETTRANQRAEIAQLQSRPLRLGRVGRLDGIYACPVCTGTLPPCKGCGR